MSYIIHYSMGKNDYEKLIIFHEIILYKMNNKILYYLLYTGCNSYGQYK